MGGKHGMKYCHREKNQSKDVETGTKHEKRGTKTRRICWREEIVENGMKKPLTRF